MAKDNYYLKHDSNAAHDPKVAAMIQRFGMEGYGRFWRLAEILREQADHHLPRGKWGLTSVANAWGCAEKDADEFLESLISTYELLRTDGETVWSDRLLRDMDLLDKKREQARQKANARWEKENSMQKPCNGNAIASESDATAQKNDADAMQGKARLGIGKARLGKASSNDATPPAAAAFSVPALKKRLADASILTTPAELENIAALLIAKSVDCETFIAWALAKAAKARQPSSWFAKGLLEWDWIGKWRENGSASKPAEPAKYEPIEPHHSTPEDDVEVERLAAEARARLHMVAPVAGVVEGSTNELDAIPF